MGIKDKEVEYFTEWWNQANTVKNNGLYVGFVNGNWTTPKEINQETFNKNTINDKTICRMLEIITELQQDVHYPAYGISLNTTILSLMGTFLVGVE